MHYAHIGVGYFVLFCFVLFFQCIYLSIFIRLFPPGCSDRIKKLEMRFHVRYVCQHRVVPCRFEFCGATFPLYERAAHEAKECQHMFARNKVLSEVCGVLWLVAVWVCVCGVCVFAFVARNKLCFYYRCMNKWGCFFLISSSLFF
jgi:hypothetical protein